MTKPIATSHPIVSPQAWTAARKQLLAREKELTRLRDDVARARRALPWTRVDKPYRFETPAGPRSLAELFGDKSQLLVYHFMFAPDWEHGCKSCTFWGDHYVHIAAHLAERDVSFTAVSRAPLPKLQAYAQRLGWQFPWVSSYESDFNFDFGVSFRAEDRAAGTAMYNYAPLAERAEELPGISAFYKDPHDPTGTVLHTYSCYRRGIEVVNSTYNFLDLVAKGRDEAGLAMPMAWVKRRDER